MNFDDKDLAIMALVVLAGFAVFGHVAEPTTALLRDIVLAIAGFVTGRAMNNGNGK